MSWFFFHNIFLTCVCVQVGLSEFVCIREDHCVCVCVCVCVKSGQCHVSWSRNLMGQLIKTRPEETDKLQQTTRVEDKLSHTLTLIYIVLGLQLFIIDQSAEHFAD